MTVFVIKHLWCVAWFWLATGVHFVYLLLEVPVIALGCWLERRLERAEVGLRVARTDRRLRSEQRARFGRRY